MRALDNFPGGGERLFDVWNLMAQPPQAGFAIRDDSREWLIHFMRDRCAHLSERGHARDVRELSLCALQRFLRFPGRSDIHQRTNEFLLAHFVDLTMRANMNMFDDCVGHQQTVLVIVILLASYRAIELLLHELAIVRVNALQDQTDGRLDGLIESHDPIGFL